MAYGNLLADVVQSSTAGVAPQFNDGNGTQIGTLCRAWVKTTWNGSAVSINASFNVSSVTRTATGSYTVSMANALPDANYSVSCNGQTSTTYPNPIAWADQRLGTFTSSTFYVTTTSGAFANADTAALCVSVFR